MRLSPREQESLLVHHAGSLAQKRLARGLRLNYPEAIGLIACVLQELVRDGTRSIAELMSLSTTLLGTAQVMPGVANMIHEVQVEATFPDGTKLITAHDPIKSLHGNLELALYGSFLPVPDVKVFEREILLDKASGFVHQNNVTAPEQQRPGEIIPVDDGGSGLELNAGRKIATLSVTSTCDRAIQVSSHFHFIEVNPRLLFDRRKALGMRLNIPAGTAVRFEPGDRKTVQLVEIAGKRIVRGGNLLCNGEAKDERWNEILQRIQAGGFLHQEELPETFKIAAVVAKIPRRLYVAMYGPTVGDRVRLGDTSLIIQVERDFAVYGDECTFGGGKTLREAMGQATGITNSDGAPDTVIVNALILDAQLGIVKADVGIRNGFICGIGKAGNPDCMDNVDPALIFGAGTEAISGDGLILTAGAIDSHVHFICPQICREAIASGITTVIGGGTGPATGTCATTCSPGPNNIKMMLQATDNMPMNFGFTGKGNTSITSDDRSELAAPLVEQIRAGACGLKLHEDWGTTPSAIDAGLAVGQAFDVQITIHTDTLNESACVEESIKAFAGRSIHAYHSEGAGGGHAPDIIRVCGEPNVIPSSTNPTRPLTHNTMDEHMDMLMVCHHLNRNLKEDIAFAESRIRAETMAAEDILHDLGAISIISSDSQAMGRVGEVICRTWQTADKMKLVRGTLHENDEGFGVANDAGKGSQENDNFRAKRYIAKYTINPAIVSGVSHLIGSIAVGKLADLVLWRPDHFGAKPEMVIKGGTIAWSQMGMPNASIPPVEPVKQRKMFGSYGAAAPASSVAFVSQACVESGMWKEYGLRKRIEAVKGCRDVGKKNMIMNAYLPNIKVNPETFRVSISRPRGEGEAPEVVVLECGLSMRLPLAQRYFLF